MAEKKNFSQSFTFGQMQSGANFSKNKDKNAIDSDNTNSHEQNTLSAENSKKKRRRRNRGKSEPVTSRTETQTATEYETNPDCSKTFLKSYKMQKLIAARISAIESGTNEPKSIVHNKKYKISPSSSQERQTICSTKDKNVLDSSKDKKGFVFANESKNHDSINPFKNDRVEFDGRKLDCLDTFLDKCVDVIDLFKARTSAIESRKTEPTCMEKHKIECSFSEKEKRKVDIATKVENIANFFKENPDTISDDDDDGSTYSFNRPVIFVTDKSTQTDPLLETQKNLKHIDGENISAFTTDSDFAVNIEATESDLLPPEKSNLENISAFTTDSDFAVNIEATESDLLPPEKPNLENISKGIDIRKISGPKISSLDENLQNDREEFLRNLKIKSKNFVDDFINFLKNEK